MNTSVDLHRHAMARAYQLYGARCEQSGICVRFIGALLGLSLWSCPGPAHADVAPRPDTPEGLVRARLVAESTSLQRRQSSWLAVQLTMKPGWHTYWRNPGDSGLATSIKWTVPQGVTAGPTVWPRPERFVSRSIVGYGYTADVALLATVTLPARFASDRITIGASVSWLACSDICIPGSETLKLTLPVGNTAPKADPAQARLFAEMRQRIPRPAPFAATFIMDEEQIRLRFPGAAFSGISELSAVFYPFDSSLIEHGASQAAVRDKGHIELTLRRSPAASDQLGMLHGLLIVEESASGTVKLRAFDVSARRATTAGHPLRAQ